MRGGGRGEVAVRRCVRVDNTREERTTSNKEQVPHITHQQSCLWQGDQRGWEQREELIKEDTGDTTLPCSSPQGTSPVIPR